MDKALSTLLMEKKPVLIQKWCQLIMDTYPKDTSRFLREQNDEFTNPVGHTINQSVEKIYSALLQDNEDMEVDLYLRDMIKVRAVQSFTPSQAIGFVFLLKKVIREELAKMAEEASISKALLEFETKIDQLALASFDIYSECREKLSDLKTMELKNMTFRLLKQANLVTENLEKDATEKRV